MASKRNLHVCIYSRRVRLTWHLFRLVGIIVIFRKVWGKQGGTNSLRVFIRSGARAEEKVEFAQKKTFLHAFTPCLPNRLIACYAAYVIK